MKSLKYLLIIISVSVLFISGCENENNKKSAFTGTLVSASPCKSGSKSASEKLSTSDTLSCLNYLFDDSDNKLTIKHINAAFNCCPESIYCTVSLSYDTIIISEYEAMSQCNCDCLYDLDFVINGVESKEYNIKLNEPYSGEQAKISFKLDLVNDKNSSFCVKRKSYPWG
jgi:hypothetical protein